MSNNPPTKSPNILVALIPVVVLIIAMPGILYATLSGSARTTALTAWAAVVLVAAVVVGLWLRVRG